MVRADGTLTSPEGAVLALLLVRRGAATYVETADGFRAIAKPGKAVVLERGRPRRAAPSLPIAGSDLLLEDLAPFTAGRLAVPQLSDDAPLGIAVTGAPVAPSAYALLVVTVDPRRMIPVRTKYYVGHISNLAKMRRDADLVTVGGRHWPGTVSVEHFRPARTTRLRLAWREAPELRPGLGTLAGPSLLPASAPPG